MYMSEVDIFIYISLLLYLSRPVSCKGGVRFGGGGGSTGTDTRKYPSQSRRSRYYKYYMKYLTGEGYYYATYHVNDGHSVCQNYEPFPEDLGWNNDTSLGSFPCPMGTDPSNFKYCCGDSRFEYCCRLIDTPEFRLKVGFGAAAGLGLILGVIIFIVCYCKGKKRQRQRKKSAVQQMNQMGITRYQEVDNKNFKAEQSDDGYHIHIKFKKKQYYQLFWAELYTMYQKHAWRLGHHKGTKECKVTFPEGGWVSLILVDELDGVPQMVVSREKAAVKWMETTFVDICDTIPDNSGCLCFKGGGNRRKNSQVHPTTNDNSNSKKYQNLPEEGSSSVTMATSDGKPGGSEEDIEANRKYNNSSPNYDLSRYDVGPSY